MKIVLFFSVVLWSALLEAKTYKVNIGAMKFIPELVTVKIGDKIIWTNEDIGIHTATSKDFHSGSIRPKKSWSYVTTTAGEFPYKCLFHSGMKGTLIVKE
jgi:plastocyanin